MPNLTIRNLDAETRARLHAQATRNGRSLEAEAREILRRSLGGGSAGDMARRIRARFADIGGWDVEPVAREPLGPPPDLPL